MNNTYVKQKLDELHLIDDFLFFQMMNHPKYGPKFSRLLLKLILGRDVGKLHVIPQKEYYGENTDLHGARLDVYLEEEDGIVLADYKTDLVKDPKELILRYRVQLDYYEEALVRLTGKCVKEKLIYSFGLEQEITL